MVKNKLLIAVDIDDTLAKGQYWGKEELEPIQEMIDLVNDLYIRGHHIIIHTARKEWWRTATEKWLQDNKIHYHALVMNKLPADYYIDDKAITPKEIKEFIIKHL